MGDGFRIWAEENDRFLVSLAIFAAILIAISLAGWAEGKNQINTWMGKSNIVELQDICNAICESGNEFKYCEIERFLVYDEPVWVAHMVPTPGGIGEEAITRPLIKIKGTCEEMATGKTIRMNNQGNIQEFRITFPGMRVNNCAEIC